MKRRSRSRLSVSTFITLTISTHGPRVLTDGQRSTRAESVSSAAPGRVDPSRRRLLYSQRDPVPVPSPKEFAAMTETEQEAVREKKGGKRKLLAFLALIGAVIAALAFWRRRGAEEEE